MVRTLPLVVVMVVLGPVAGCSFLQAEETNDLTGTITVADMGIRAIGDPCSGRRPYLDLRPGAAVLVRDADDEILGEGRVGEGEAINAHPDLDHLDRTLTYCRLDFTVPDVGIADGYELEFGDGHTAALEPPDPDSDAWFVEIVIPQ